MNSLTSKFVAYLRVSTAKQGRSGLGLEAQREAVRQFVASRGGKIIAPVFVEVETGKRNDRPELDKALKRCRLTGATLVVAIRPMDDPQAPKSEKPVSGHQPMFHDKRCFVAGGPQNAFRELKAQQKFAD